MCFYTKLRLKIDRVDFCHCEAACGCGNLLLWCPKFVARYRSPNFDRCHSLLLAVSATGSARKRPVQAVCFLRLPRRFAPRNDITVDFLLKISMNALFWPDYVPIVAKNNTYQRLSIGVICLKIQSRDPYGQTFCRLVRFFGSTLHHFATVSMKRWRTAAN